MASCRALDLRALVAIVCGLLTIIVLGLAIWRTVVRINREQFKPPSSIPIEFCRNGGTWKNGRCICTEMWKGLRCTIVNFCENSTFENFTFGRIPVGRYGSSLETCEKDTANAGYPKASRLCNLTENGEKELQNATIGNCDITLQILESQINEISTNSSSISEGAQMLTSNSSLLTPDNITAAAKVVGQIFNTSRHASPEAKKVAVTTVSQLLDASEDVFEKAAAADNNTFATLAEQMEIYSLSLGNNSVVSPNIAVQSITLPSGGNVDSTNVLFTVEKGTSSSLISGSTRVDMNMDNVNPDERTELQILVNTSNINAKSYGFVVYQNNKLFQSKIFTTKTNFTQKIISSRADTNKKDPSASVEMVFLPQHNPKEFQLHSYACVYWNFATNDWDTKGCHKDKEIKEFLHCRCNHTTNFAVLMSFKKNYEYPKSLDVLSTIGCALSITGLALTIVFQIVTRKGRKTSVTWVLVSLCTSMLIFNLLFVFGIDNSNKNLKKNGTTSIASDSNTNKIPPKDIAETPNITCTVMAVLLHYFLLVTFAWTGLNATQLYFLLIRTMKPLPRHFILFLSLIGWGVPAVVVAMTVGITFSLYHSEWQLHYRQEKICWLATPDGTSIMGSLFLWSFIVPVTIILIGNVVIFIVIIVKVLWKKNQNLTSTKNVSLLKKIFSTISIAVVFGITWILAYFMFFDNEKTTFVFSYIFCIFNTTEGLQIFIFHVVTTKIFQNEASKVWKSLSSSAERVKSLSSGTSLKLQLRVRMYNMLKSWPALNERFRLLEPSVFTEEMTLSETDHENASI